ncbi:hypothetical protein XaraCFBP7407_21275 [Xanthomonas arboricola pv. arracaciae]|nr:hypothetical protein XaraCFBP7407_21275 [Xanthomonas arboricola pv. arracaciae]
MQPVHGDAQAQVRAGPCRDIRGQRRTQGLQPRRLAWPAGCTAHACRQGGDARCPCRRLAGVAGLSR